MSMSARDRKLLLLLVPVIAIVGYWFLLLAPQRQEASTAAIALTKQEKARDSAVARVTQLQSTKAAFGADYQTVVRLGKAIPTKLDMASLIVQLDSASKGTGIRFDKIAAGEDVAAAATPPAAAPSSGSEKPADPGGTAAQSTSGKTAETAGNAADSSSAQAKKSEGTSATDTKSSTSSDKGLPVGGGSTSSPAAPATPGACAPGLECVPLDFEFKGSFFDLADFFHRLKRFVRVAGGDRVSVKGRLMTVDGFKLTTEDAGFQKLKAEVRATVYLSPKGEGATAGATPAGPAPGSSQSASSGDGPSGLPTPTAASTP
jgi:hypothetical protein